MIAQSDDPELLEWLVNAQTYGGSLVSAVARAALVADDDNYEMLRPVVLHMRAKYPRYEPSDALKQKIRERVKP